MNDDKMILDKLNNASRNRKKWFLIAGIVGVLIAIMVVLIIIIKPGKEESNSKTVSSSTEKYDTTKTGDAQIDRS